MIREDVILKTRGNAPQRGAIARISRYGLGGRFILPSRPVSVRIRGDGEAEMVATPGGRNDPLAKAVRRAAMETGPDPYPGGRADRSLWFARRR